MLANPWVPVPPFVGSGSNELIRDGYLCPLVTKAGVNRVDTSALHVSGGEYIAGEVEDLMDQQWLVEAACGETVGC
jgi:DNA repair protein RadD